MARSASMSPCASYQPSRHTSYSPSPNSSSFPSPVSSTIVADGNSLIPWLRNLSASSSSSSASSSKFTHQYFHSGSISAPVTPLLNSPTARTPRLRAGPGWAVPQYPFLPLSTPPSPVSEPKWYDGVPVPQSGHTSPTFSFVSSSPFGFRVEDLARGGAGQSGTCSPSVAAVCEEIPMAEVISNEFAFGSNVSKGVVRAWEGERIHEECGQDELELTLGPSKTR